MSLDFYELAKLISLGIADIAIVPSEIVIRNRYADLLVALPGTLIGDTLFAYVLYLAEQSNLRIPEDYTLILLYYYEGTHKLYYSASSGQQTFEVAFRLADLYSFYSTSLVMHSLRLFTPPFFTPSMNLNKRLRQYPVLQYYSTQPTCTLVNCKTL